MITHLLDGFLETLEKHAAQTRTPASYPGDSRRSNNREWAETLSWDHPSLRDKQYRKAGEKRRKAGANMGDEVTHGHAAAQAAIKEVKSGKPLSTSTYKKSRSLGKIPLPSKTRRTQHLPGADGHASWSKNEHAKLTAKGYRLKGTKASRVPRGARKGIISDYKRDGFGDTTNDLMRGR